MSKDPLRELAVYKNRSRRFEARWQALCDRYFLPATEDSIWRYHHAPDPQRPTQGWKLHVSATLLNACTVLKRVGDFLATRAVEFKAPQSLHELIKINSGLFYGYSQVGKIITVYPRTPAEAIALARQLYKLTCRLTGPAVPFDLRFGGNIYYRFGAFTPLEIEHEDGRRTPAIRAPDGMLVPDERVSEHARPGWVSDPLAAHRLRTRSLKVRNPLAASFRVFRALVQRGKGGVYQAVDLRANRPRLCLLKEGRRHGELTWAGRDGARLVRHEEHVIAALLASGVAAPRIYSSFELSGNYYLITEFIEGESLHNLLNKRERRMSVPLALGYGLQLSDIFRQLHAAGWAWRDCKPANILVTPEGKLRPLDFEGACPVDQPDAMFWGTPGFTPPEWRESNRQTCTSGDLYALGAMLYLLLTGRVPATTALLPVEKLRRNVPTEVRALIMRLLSHNPELRPPAENVARELHAALSGHRVKHAEQLPQPAVKRADEGAARGPGGTGYFKRRQRDGASARVNVAAAMEG